MLNYKLRSRGFHPRRCGSPDAINPKQVIHHYPEKRRGGTGDRHALLHRTCILNFISMEKEFYRANNSIFQQVFTT